MNGLFSEQEISIFVKQHCFMKKVLLSTILLAFTILISTTSSCKKDKVKGCMNSEARNYSSDANEDDGSCSFKRDKFMGTYNGTKFCSTLSTDTLISISITPDGTEYTKVIINDFPESGSSVKASVNSQNELLLIIPSQTIGNDLEVFTISGVASYYEDQIVLNYIKDNSSVLDTCGVVVNKVN